jgi:hypothetical protein
MEKSIYEPKETAHMTASNTLGVNVFTAPGIHILCWPPGWSLSSVSVRHFRPARIPERQNYGERSWMT